MRCRVANMRIAGKATQSGFFKNNQDYILLNAKQIRTSENRKKKRGNASSHKLSYCWCVSHCDKQREGERNWCRHGRRGPRASRKERERPAEGGYQSRAGDRPEQQAARALEATTHRKVLLERLEVLHVSCRLTKGGRKRLVWIRGSVRTL